MSKKYFTAALVAIVLAVLLGAAAATAFAVDADSDSAVKTARAEVTVVSQPADTTRSTGSAGVRTVQDFRDSAALVLIGSMLIGLAAAVRRTA